MDHRIKDLHSVQSGSSGKLLYPAATACSRTAGRRCQAILALGSRTCSQLDVLLELAQVVEVECELRVRPAVCNEESFPLEEQVCGREGVETQDGESYEQGERSASYSMLHASHVLTHLRSARLQAIQRRIALQAVSGQQSRSSCRQSAFVLSVLCSRLLLLLFPALTAASTLCFHSLQRKDATLRVNRVAPSFTVAK